MKRYLLTDVIEIRLTPVYNGRWSYYIRCHVMNDGEVHAALPVNTREQAVQSARDFFPNAHVTLADGALPFDEETA